MRTIVQAVNYDAAVVSYPIMENVLKFEADFVTVDQDLKAKTASIGA